MHFLSSPTKQSLLNIVKFFTRRLDEYASQVISGPSAISPPICAEVPRYTGAHSGDFEQ